MPEENEERLLERLACELLRLRLSTFGCRACLRMGKPICTVNARRERARPFLDLSYILCLSVVATTVDTKYLLLLFGKESTQQVKRPTEACSVTMIGGTLPVLVCVETGQPP